MTAPDIDALTNRLDERAADDKSAADYCDRMATVPRYGEKARQYEQDSREAAQALRTLKAELDALRADVQALQGGQPVARAAVVAELVAERDAAETRMAQMSEELRVAQAREAALRKALEVWKAETHKLPLGVVNKTLGDSEYNHRMAAYRHFAKQILATPSPAVERLMGVVEAAETFTTAPDAKATVEARLELEDAVIKYERYRSGDAE